MELLKNVMDIYNEQKEQGKTFLILFNKRKRNFFKWLAFKEQTTSAGDKNIDDFTLPPGNTAVNTGKH